MVNLDGDKNDWLSMRHFLMRLARKAGVGLIYFSVLAVHLAFGQDRTTVQGTVSSSDGAPLAGVTVKEVGTSNAVSTDSNGTFSLATAGTRPFLEFSMVGFDPIELVALPQMQVMLYMKQDVLDEVVVVGYGTQRKGDVTGSIASVSGEDIRSLPVPDAGQALQGRAAGVQVVSPGAPGSNVTLRIRGMGTINNADPLLVIDGIPTDVPLNTLNPNDIASMEVLKDASAAAIYGSRGANGVVLITTRRGVAGRAKLELNAYSGIQRATGMVELLSAAQFAAMHNEMMANNGQGQNPAFADPSALGAGTDWLGELFATAPMQHYGLSYAGGTDESNYYVSGTVMDQQGIVIHTGYRRYTAQLNMESKALPWLKIGNNLTFNHDVKQSGSYDIRNAMAALPTQPIFNADGSYAGPVGQPSWVGDVANPIGKATLNSNTTKGYNILANVYAEVKIIDGFTFRTTGGAQAMFWDSRNWAPKYDWQPIPQPNSYLSQQYNKNLTWLWDNYFTFERTIADDHRLTVLAGSSAQNNRYDYINGAIQEFASENTSQLNNGTSQPTVGGSGNEWALLSFMARANYSFKDRYLVTATLRQDGSSRFGPDNRWGTFPSASVAWRLSEEDFMKNAPTAVSDLKLRVGYGVTGNQNIGNYPFASVLQTVQYAFNGQPVSAIVPQRIPNPVIHWEEVAQTNVGVDLGLFDNRITMTLDAYIKNTNGMLVPMAVPISTGYSDIVVPEINAGKIQNKGVELAVQSQNFTGEFQWNTMLNFSLNRNKVLSLNSDVPMYTGSIGLNQNLAIHHEGYPANAFYGFVTNGVFQTEAEVSEYAVQVPGDDTFNRTSPGDIRFLDLDNNGIIDDNDRTFIGNPNPSFIWAMNNSLSYKGFDATVFLQGVVGNDIFNANRIYQEGMAVAQNQTTAVLDRWNGEGSSTVMPRAVFNDPNKNTRVSDRFLEDGSYLRVKNVTLGYTLPNALSHKARISAVRLYVSAHNLWTITTYSGFDPEVPANGIDLNVYPVMRTLSAGINLSF
ncbi:SusC/RagA family TonB-linked outer membrane protein [Parapedobacter soli]|uniref:SusC/RagA family TonB-linked outer membrane protein n=1 Tax=Parapedobacter soli TaxID=416955 RepID=UPI0021C75E56|nr:TonB-dependent receptor [Parapedobacter soli]